MTDKSDLFRKIYDGINDTALEIVKSDFPQTSQIDLEKWIKSNGYSNNPSPHENNKDFITIFLKNIFNSGYRGYPEIVEIIINTIEKNYTFNNSEIDKIQIQSLSNDCLNYLENINSNKKIEIIRQLNELKEGKKNNKSIYKIFNSLCFFLKTMKNKYGGYAKEFSYSFFLEENIEKFPIHIKSHSDNLVEIPQIGSALAMNFIKDTQINLIKNKSDKEIFHLPIGWCVKPDMHVMRIMFALTNPENSLDKINENIISAGKEMKIWEIKLSNLEKEYIKKNSKFINNYSLINKDYNKKDLGLWKCIEDIQYFGKKSGIPPIKFDRLIYLVGSGKFKNTNIFGKDNKGKKIRYGQLFNKLT